MTTFSNILDKFRNYSVSERDKGSKFERLMQLFLQTYPVYAGRFTNIWLWNEFPFRKDFGGKDTGIDLVAKTNEGDFWAIQCKCFSDESYINKPDVDSFLSTSSKTFQDDQMNRKSFAVRLWISTTNKWGSEAENTLQNQNPLVTRLSLYDLENADVDWGKLEQGLYGVDAQTSKKKLYEHQQRALDNFIKHFETNDRGKLVMACGTGKTFTSLKIAEKQTGDKGVVLFLVPSIALLGQTLREWAAQAEHKINPICICSDPEVSKQKTKNEEGDGYSVKDLALPASTSIPDIVNQLKFTKNQEGMTVVFSTYQSIEVISKAQKDSGIEFDLIVCDEAHRTTGYTTKDSDDSAFVKVHDNNFIKSKKRIYMTATPRLYDDASKQKAAQNEVTIWSMDDEEIYGPEVFRIGFGEAVDKKLLSDYKVLVLTISEDQIPAALQSAISDSTKEINVDDAVKLIGCINALSKRMLIDEGLLKSSDPNPMHKAVAFCQSIKISKHITDVFNEYKDTYYSSLTEADRAELVKVQAKHVDGTMSAPERDELLGWLKSTKSDSTDCHILTNVRCLSEGVDVPSLDAVMFLSARNSQVDVVQSVGRVMRRAEGKNYGYIIIPVIVPANIKPEEALNDNKRFEVVWSVLNALRAHDDRFEATVTKIELNKKKPDPKKGGNVLIGGIPAENTGDSEGGKKRTATQLGLALPAIDGIRNAIYARMVQKVGQKRYWEQWGKDVADIAQRYIARITKLVEADGEHQKIFNKFVETLRSNINPSLSSAEVIEMLSQHLITRPVFEALFENYSFVKNNPVSQSLQEMIDLLEKSAPEKDTITLSRFYESVKLRISDIDNAEGKQKVIVELYNTFFKAAFPKTVEKLGIVYTPIEVVDFINNSVAKVLEKEFGRNLSDENVHIIDPFTGTGTFITRLIQSGLISKESLKRKFDNELHANEIVLLAYYIASVNIENAFHDMMGEDQNYTPFNGICLTDTFQLYEDKEDSGVKNSQITMSSEIFGMTKNTERIKAQQNAPIQVIIGNPPYSIGQKTANDNAKNQTYPKLEGRISETYVAKSNAALVRGAYDPYIAAFRWATDRLSDDGGIIAFVSNGGWLDTNSSDGFRKCLEHEFYKIYVFNLRGNQRTNGELSRKEGGKIFGSGSRTPISITILVKKHTQSAKAIIEYNDIGDYLTREEKLQIIRENHDIYSDKLEWSTIKSNEQSDWLNQRSTIFDTFISLEPDKKTSEKSKSVFQKKGNGLATSRDAWLYNYSKNVVKNNADKMIDFYNVQREDYRKKKVQNSNLLVEDFINNDPKNISWSRGLRTSLGNGKVIEKIGKCVNSLYRPFCSQKLFYNKSIVETCGVMKLCFPSEYTENLIICVSGAGSSKESSAIITDRIMDLNLMSAGAQCFPLYYYEETKGQTGNLFDHGKQDYVRRDGITDFILKQCRDIYGDRVNKEDIFYYVYGLLHSSDYRTKFSADLKKMLPRLPLVDKPTDFWSFSKAGRELAELHLNYESIKPLDSVVVSGENSENFTVDKMRWVDKKTKSEIQYNSFIKVSNIPAEALDYVVNGKSAIEWIMERYQKTIDKSSGITNDPNDWAKEHNKPRYILNLLLSVIALSVKTQQIVHSLPKLEWKE
ncbi:DEAD/DEAH box helicase family protein [Lachnospiraceae bacterium OttesenSCG-928-E19]|nr:DEAD/DEAH box helicase family protein [Lachnospiraceae bacterium OttesenSCG-928-E19]